MKTIVSIPNFGLSKIDFLKRVVDEFSSFTPPFKVDINIVSNVPLPMISGAKTVEIAHLDNWRLLYLPGIPGKIRREFEHFFTYFKH